MPSPGAIYYLPAMRNLAKIRLSPQQLSVELGLPGLVTDVVYNRNTNSIEFIVEGTGLPKCHEGNYPAILSYDSVRTSRKVD